MTCRIVQKVCKTYDEVKRWGFDYVRDPETGKLGFLARGWRPGQIYATDVCVLPTRAFSGLQFSSSGGQSGRREPVWPTTVGATVTDGSITWTAEEITNDCLLATIVTSDWLADPEFTVSDEQLINVDGVQSVTALISGGTVGGKGEVRNVVTLSNGAIEESVLQVSTE